MTGVLDRLVMTSDELDRLRARIGTVETAGELDRLAGLQVFTFATVGQCIVEAQKMRGHRVGLVVDGQVAEVSIDPVQLDGRGQRLDRSSRPHWLDGPLPNPLPQAGEGTA